MNNIVNISEEKLNDPIKNVRLFDRSYIKKAKIIAKAIIEFDPNGTEELYNGGDEETKQIIREIRCAATADQEILKGDYVILTFVDLLREEQERKNYIDGKGKFLNASDELISDILINNKNKKNVSEFCRNKGIHRSKYYRILNRKLKQKKDIQRIEEIAKSLCNNE